jgi:hypothetical protein
MIAHRLGIKSDMVGLPGEAFDRQSMQIRIENRHFELKRWLFFGVNWIGTPKV